MATNWQDTDWHPGTGTIAERTNVVIRGLIDWCLKSNTEKVTQKNITDAIRELTPISGKKTVTEYIERVVTHGPFKSDGVTTWRLQNDKL